MQSPPVGGTQLYVVVRPGLSVFCRPVGRTTTHPVDDRLKRQTDLFVREGEHIPVHFLVRFAMEVATEWLSGVRVHGGRAGYLLWPNAL
jgi:hypothetical protein